MLTLFEHAHEITAKDIAELFGYQPRSSTWLCQRWVEAGFLAVADASRKGRRYRLAEKFGIAVSDDA